MFIMNKAIIHYLPRQLKIILHLSVFSFINLRSSLLTVFYLAVWSSLPVLSESLHYPQFYNRCKTNLIFRHFNKGVATGEWRKSSILRVILLLEASEKNQLNLLDYLMSALLRYN